MKSNRAVARGQFDGPASHKTSQRFWIEVSEGLNALGGAKKTPEQWRKCWVDWKGAVKKQYVALKKFKNKTGNLPASDGPKPMEGIDQEVVDFFSMDLVEGDGKTPEGGFIEENVCIYTFQSYFLYLFAL